MNIKSTILAAATGLAFLATQASAGGPVIVEDPEVTARSNVVPLILALILIGVAVSGGDEETPDKGCKTLEGC